MDVTRFARTRGQARRAAAMMASAQRTQKQQKQQRTKSGSESTSGYFHTASADTTPRRSLRRKHVQVKYEDDSEQVNDNVQGGQEQVQPPASKTDVTQAQHRLTKKAKRADANANTQNATDSTSSLSKSQVSPPPHWKEIYDNIKAMRSKR